MKHRVAYPRRNPRPSTPVFSQRGNLEEKKKRRFVAIGGEIELWSTEYFCGWCSWANTGVRRARGLLPPPPPPKATFSIGVARAVGVHRPALPRCSYQLRIPLLPLTALKDSMEASYPPPLLRTSTYLFFPLLRFP